MLGRGGGICRVREGDTLYIQHQYTPTERGRVVEMTHSVCRLATE